MRIITKVRDADEQNNTNVQQITSFEDLHHKDLYDKTVADKNDANSLLKAKSRFVSVVSQTISSLMTKKGYSRRRATTLILQRIRGQNKPPPVEKVRKNMLSHKNMMNSQYTI